MCSIENMRDFVMRGEEGEKKRERGKREKEEEGLKCVAALSG